MRFHAFLAIIATIAFPASSASVGGFNEAFGSSIASEMLRLVAAPWEQALDILHSSFSSGPGCIYNGDGLGDSGRPHRLLDVNRNETQRLVWSLFKPLYDDPLDASTISWVYVAFLDGAFAGYTSDDNSTLYLQENRNTSLRGYVGVTSQVTGEPVGRPSVSIPFDATGRPWYLAAMEAGAAWSDPYSSVEDSALGITAARQLVTATKQMLGVAGADFKLAGIEMKLASLVAGFDDRFTVFIVQDDGFLIASSVPGISTGKDSSLVHAPSASNVVVSTFSQKIENQVGKWRSSFGKTFSFQVPAMGPHWGQVYPVVDSFGLSWHCSVVEKVSCSRGYYPSVVVDTWINISDSDDEACLPCPVGAFCEGGSTLPYPAEGYWINRKSIAFAGFVEACPYATCPGFHAKAKELWKRGKIQSPADATRCWTKSSNGTLCSNSDDLMCTAGSTGPLCGSCSTGFVYNAGMRGCVRCESSRNLAAPITVSCVLLLFLVAVASRIAIVVSPRAKACFEILRKKCTGGKMLHIASILDSIDQGTVKVIWGTIQILSSISWNLQIEYPKPFGRLLNFLTFSEVDFLVLKCTSFRTNFLHRVLLLSFIPLGIVLANLCLLFMRLRFPCLIGALDSEVAFRRRTSNQRQSLVTNILGGLPEDKHAPMAEEADSRVTTLNPDLNEESKDLRIGSTRAQRVTNQHVYIVLIIIYTFLPTISLAHFQALKCVELGDGSSYLMVDTSVECTSAEYRSFVPLNACLILVYQSVPCIWLILMGRERAKLNPQVQTRIVKSRSGSSFLASLVSSCLSLLSPQGTGEPESNHTRKVSNARQYDATSSSVTLWHLRFLWQDYRPETWFFEVLDIWRRVTMVALLPLLRSSAVPRAALGCFLSILVVAFMGGCQPFKRHATNAALMVTCYQILLSYFAGFSLLVGVFDLLQLDDFTLGLGLTFVNFTVIVLAASWYYSRWRADRQLRKARKSLTGPEKELLLEALSRKFPQGGGNPLAVSGSGSITTASVQPSGHHGEDLKQFLLKDEHVNLIRQVGSGSFGLVFEGTCLGQRVAVKTMIDVTQENANKFREEIILTARLRHPNIVSFVGACWTGDLICLVLEWVSGGSLENFVQRVDGERGGVPLLWEDPLLKLATDVARGMAYLHNASYIDEKDGIMKQCVLHRDLKLENILVTNFLSAKISDFGSSRAKDLNDVTMSAVGTPLFCSPEIMRGDMYDEKADVYSFGLVLLALAVEAPLVDWIGERYRVHSGKKPKLAMRFIRRMVEDGWRPVTLEIGNNLPAAPRTVLDLIVRCCAHDPAARPSFEQALHELKGRVAAEVQAGNVVFGNGEAFSRADLDGNPIKKLYLSSSGKSPLFAYATDETDLKRDKYSKRGSEIKWADIPATAARGSHNVSIEMAVQKTTDSPSSNAPVTSV